MYENAHLYFIFAPVACAAAVKIIRRRAAVEYFSITFSILLLMLSYYFLSGVGSLSSKILPAPFFGEGIFYADHLCAYMAFLISLIFCVTSIYSSDYLNHEIEHGIISERKVPDYYCRSFLFVSAMMTVPLTIT